MDDLLTAVDFGKIMLDSTESTKVRYVRYEFCICTDEGGRKMLQNWAYDQHAHTLTQPESTFRPLLKRTLIRISYQDEVSGTQTRRRTPNPAEVV
jgi:hypothetical protein